MFSLLSIQLHKNSTSKEAQKTQWTVLEYEYSRLQKPEKDVLESYLWARENHFSRNQLDANGKCTMQDEKGQIFNWRWCYQADRKILWEIRLLCFNYRWLEDIMAFMRENLQTSIGNTYAFVTKDCMTN
jgi:hypothetical protein